MQNAAHPVSLVHVAALQNFFRDERRRRGWSVRDAAARAKISPSKAYAIENGDDNVEFETFENIATAFGLTPAELATAIGKGKPDHDPDEASLLAAYRQVPHEKRPAAHDMLHGLVVRPITPPRRRRRVTDEPGTFGRDKVERSNQSVKPTRRLPSYMRIRSNERELSMETQRLAREIGFGYMT